MFKLFSNQYAPVTEVPPIGSGGSMGKEDIIDFLGSDDKEEVIPLKDDKDDKEDTKKEEKEDIKDTKKTSKETDEDVDDEVDEDDDVELSELEEDLEEPDDEKLELVTPVRRSEILKVYPDLFKKFPYLEKAYYREQQFTEIHPTIEDARESRDKADTLDKFESDLNDGNIENVLLAAKQSNPKSFNKIADDYLQVLSRVDNNAYTHVLGNTLKHTIRSMVQEGRAQSNDTLISAAQILNQFAFGSSTFADPTKLATDDPKEDAREVELKRKESELSKRVFTDALDGLNTRVNNAYKATIAANIDPKESMSAYVRNNATRDALENLDTLISSDKRFKVLVDKLWEKAAKEDFSKSSVDTIRSAFLSKAKTLLPSVIKKARNEALRGMGKRVRDDSEDDSKESKTRDKTNERPRSTESSGKSKGVPKGMSTLEFLMSD